MPAFKKGDRVVGRYWPWKGKLGIAVGFPVIGGERRVRVRWDDDSVAEHSTFSVNKVSAEPEPERSFERAYETKFPEPPEIRHRALSAYILTVARTRVDGTWAAYVGVVRGLDHRMERHGVLELGTKLDEKVARALFPEFDGTSYAH